MAQIAIFDIEGTLVDNNYQHALAWFRALRRHGIVVPIVRIHRHLGMGGDQLVSALAGRSAEQELGDELRDAWVEEFDPMLEEVEPLPGAHDLVAELKGRGLTVVLASSGKPKHVEHFVDLLRVRDLVDAWTTSEDVEKTKPEPDLIHVALDRVGGDPGDAVMIGDSVWDIEAAGKVGVPSLAIRTGGYGDDELIGAGASAVYDSPAELLARLDGTPLGR
jgi:HAD superfamily hydrolase (TIGR01509 family)